MLAEPMGKPVTKRQQRRDETPGVTGDQVREARAILGRMWGIGRPLHMSELGRALRLAGRDPGATVRDMERRDKVSGPASVAIEMMLGGALPPDGIEAIRKRD